MCELIRPINDYQGMLQILLVQWLPGVYVSSRTDNKLMAS